MKQALCLLDLDHCTSVSETDANHKRTLLAMGSCTGRLRARTIYFTCVDLLHNTIDAIVQNCMPRHEACIRGLCEESVQRTL